MREALGYALQLAGFVVVGAGLAIGVGAGRIRAELGLMVLGIVLFAAGRALGGRGKR